MWKIVAAAVVIASALSLTSAANAQEQPTAYDALRVVSTQLSRGMVGRIVSVTGTGGTPQPRTWIVQVTDRRQPGGVLEIEVADGRVVAQRAPANAVTSGDAAVIRTSRLNLDSNGAFIVASYTADKSGVEFTTVNYTLRNNDRGFPVWIVSLYNGRSPVGTIHIGANKGTVARVEGMFGAPQYADAQQGPAPNRRTETRGEEYYGSDDYVDDNTEGTNPVKREIKRLFRRAKDDAQRMFGRVRRSFDDYIDRVR
jgi:hypothetical protein